MKLNYILGVIIYVLSVSSCDLMGDIDNIKPKYQLEEKTYITDAKSAEQALRGVYQAWRSWDICASRSNMSLMAGSIETASGGFAGSTGFDTHSVDPENTTVTKIYTGFYSIINDANFLIEALENNLAVGIDSVRNQEIIAECKFHRGLSHFMLLRHFGQFYDVESPYGIVLRKEPYRYESPIAARNSVADCYTYILQDLTDASENCPEFVSSHAYVSRLTAKAMKVKVLLSKKDYPQAAQLAQTVIDEAAGYGYAMENDWAKIFSDHYQSSETLFAPFTMGTSEKCFIDITRTKNSNYSFQLSNKWANKSGLFTKDPRYSITFEPAPGTSQTGNGKYPDSPYSTGIGNGYIFMRLAEVYLIQAEAEARQGQTHYAAARSSLKVITDRAGYPENLVNNIPDNELLEAIREHKWLELAIENNEEWFDLVRYTESGDLQFGAVEPTLVSNWQLILPIPKNALTGNKLLVQNPEY